MPVNMVDEVPSDSPMDSSITDMIMNMVGRSGGAAAAAPAGGVSVSDADAAAGPPTLTPALPPTPMNRAAPNAPMPMPRPVDAPSPPMPPPATGSANAAPTVQPPQPPGPMIRPGSYADIAFNALRGAFTSGPNGGGSGSGSGSGSGGAGSANAAPVGRSDSGNPYSAMMPSWRPASMQPAEDPNRPAYGGKSALSGILTGTSPYATPAEAASKPDSVLDKVLNYVKNRTASGSANAAGGAKETTGDELAVRRQGEKVGPPNTQSYKATPSIRYTKPYARGGVKEGQRPPAPKQQSRAAGTARSSSRQPPQPAPQKRQGQAPQTARGGRSAYAQSLIDSMGPRGAGVTTYIEPATGNEILTGNGIYQNLGKTSTGTQKPSFTKFFS